MQKMQKKLYVPIAKKQLPFLLLSAIFLVACSGTAKQKVDSENSQIFATESPDTSTGKAKSDNGLALSDTAKPDKALPDSLKRDSLVPPTITEPDIYQEIPHLVERALFRADSLLAVGNTDAAAEIVEQFSVLKPLWEEWTARVSRMEAKIRTQQISKSEQLKPLTLQIINLNAVSSSYETVVQYTDSLIAMNPPDSLVAWAKNQALLAYHKTYMKVQTEKQNALNLARDKALFDDAEQAIMGTIMRFPSFVDTLQLKLSLMTISNMRMEESENDKAYWKTHDPQKAFAEAQELESKGKYLEAKTKWTKLKASSLRKKSMVALDSLGETYCTQERTSASNLFSKSRQHPEKAKENLTQAIAALDRCLTEFPDNKQREKVLENKAFLQKELDQ